jgi:type 1 glutamine amidotransferase
MTARLRLALLALAAPLLALAEPAPLQILLVTGGGYHDYPGQAKILTEGLEGRLHAKVTVNLSNEKKHPAFRGPGWAKGYDVVIHNTCNSADLTDPEQVKVLTEEHAGGVPAAVVHCAMHCFRPGGPHEYQKFLGVVSRNHEAHHPVTITKRGDHPVMRLFPETWTTPKGELYRILDVMPGVVELAHGVAKEQKVHLCYWAHTYGKGRVFGTTIGHHNETMRESVYLDTLARGLLWATDRLDAAGQPQPGLWRAAANP